MFSSGEKRKKTFKKAKQRLKTWETLCKEKYSGTIGRFKKDCHFKGSADCFKTNSEWSGNKNYKPSDQKRYDETLYQLNNYTKWN